MLKIAFVMGLRRERSTENPLSYFKNEDCRSQGFKLPVGLHTKISEHKYFSFNVKVGVPFPEMLFAVMKNICFPE